MSKQTAHSEYGYLNEVFLKPVRNSFINQNTLNAEWENHNFLNVPDYSAAENEFKVFESIFEKNGTSINYFPPNDRTTIDSIYCRDASVVTDNGVILCTMGKEQRKGEPRASEEHYRKIGLPILGRIEAPGTLEGGDVVWLDEQTLAVANAYRTNYAGIEQLRGFLKPQGVEVIVVDLPHYRGPSDVFHLMSIISPVDKNLAVVYSQLMPVTFRRLLIERGIQLVEVPDTEFDSLGCNVLAIAPRKCVIEERNSLTISRLQDAGAEVIPFKGKQIAIPGGGGPTCLTRPILRTI